MKDYGVSEKHWLCPVEEKDLTGGENPPKYAVSYIPTEFDRRQMTPLPLEPTVVDREGKFSPCGQSYADARRVGANLADAGEFPESVGLSARDSSTSHARTVPLTRLSLFGVFRECLIHGGARHCCPHSVWHGARRKWMNIHDQRATKPRWMRAATRRASSASPERSDAHCNPIPFHVAGGAIDQRFLKPEIGNGVAQLIVIQRSLRRWIPGLRTACGTAHPTGQSRDLASPMSLIFACLRCHFHSRLKPGSKGQDSTVLTERHSSYE